MTDKPRLKKRSEMTPEERATLDHEQAVTNLARKIDRNFDRITLNKVLPKVLSSVFGDQDEDDLDGIRVFYQEEWSDGKHPYTSIEIKAAHFDIDRVRELIKMLDELGLSGGLGSGDVDDYGDRSMRFWVRCKHGVKGQPSELAMAAARTEIVQEAAGA